MASSSKDESTFYRLGRPPAPIKESHQVVLSFDTTGSMSRYLDELRADLKTHVTRIFDTYKNVTMAVRSVECRNADFAYVCGFQEI